MIDVDQTGSEIQPPRKGRPSKAAGGNGRLPEAAAAKGAPVARPGAPRRSSVAQATTWCQCRLSGRG